MADSLRTTPAPHVRPDPAKRPKRAFHPLELFVDHAIAARLWFFVGIVAIGYATLQPYLIISAYRTRERVVVLDAAGTFYMSPLLGFEEAGKLHETHALLACLALFQRGPTGFDYPELLQKLFLPDALKQAQNEAAASAPEFAEKALHQKVEIEKITVLETRENLVLVQAEGHLERMGNFQGQVFTETPAFKARFTFARNPNLAQSGRYPLAVWKYDVAWS